MKIAIIGSRNIEHDGLQKKAYDMLCRYIPANCTEVVSGGAMGIDRLAEIYARENHLRTKIFLPDYEKYGITDKHIFEGFVKVNIIRHRLLGRKLARHDVYDCRLHKRGRPR